MAVRDINHNYIVIVVEENFMFNTRQQNQRRNRVIDHSKHESKQRIIDYMMYYGVAVVEVSTGYGDEVFYMIKKINDEFDIHKIQALTGYNIQCAHGQFINLKGREIMYYPTIDDAFSTLERIYEFMEHKPLDTDF